MSRNDYSSAKSCSGHGKMHGFTLMELMIALMLMAMIVMAATPLLSMSIRQLNDISRQQSDAGNHLGEVMQWLENDILQMRGDLPVHWTAADNSSDCITHWEFATENRAHTENKMVVIEYVEWMVEQRKIYRKNKSEMTEEPSRQHILDDVDCIKLSFYQHPRWNTVPVEDEAITAVGVSLQWAGPTVERIWPVNIVYAD